MKVVQAGTPSYFEWLQHIRKRYEHWTPFCSPYSIDDWRNLTVIERNVWGDIRYAGLPFYPQFPVGKYYVDFGEPLLRLGIEVDGKNWHLDIERDRKREAELAEMGWRIYRIPGRNTWITHEDFFPDEETWHCYYDDDRRLQEMAKFKATTSEGLAWTLKDENGDFWRKEKARIFQLYAGSRQVSTSDNKGIIRQ